MTVVIAKENTSRRNQYIAVMICAIPAFFYGVQLAWTSYTIPLLDSYDSPLSVKNISTSDRSWMGALPTMGSAISVPVGGWLLEKIGRKRCGILVGIPFMISWAIIFLADSINVILLGRFLGGFAGGIGLILGPIYIVEIAETSIRGAMSSVPNVFTVLGLLTSYIIGEYLSYGTIIVVMLSLSVIYIGLPGLIPDSPVYLLENKKEKEAFQAMAWFRGVDEYSIVVQEEMSHIRKQLGTPAAPAHLDEVVTTSKEGNIKKAVEMVKLNPTGHDTENVSQLSSWQYLKSSSSSKRALLVVTIVFILQTFMGMTAIQSYAGVIFSKAAPGMSPNMCSIFFALVMLIGALGATFACDRAGRKILLIISCCGVSICMALSGVCIQTAIAPEWLVAVLMCLYVLVYCIGALTVPFILMAEVFLPEVRALASTILGIISWLPLFILLAIYVPAEQMLGTHGVFYIFSASSIILACFTAWMVPETKGLTIEEIQDMFKNKRK